MIGLRLLPIQLLLCLHLVNCFEVDSNDKQLKDYVANSGLQNEIVNNLKPDSFNESDHSQADFLKQNLVQLILNNDNLSGLLSSRCSNRLKEYKFNLTIGTSWAFKLYDSSSKQISSLLDGTFLNLGDFEQCIQIRTDDDSDFIGRYFLINLVPFNLKFQTNMGITSKELKESNFDIEKRLAFLFKFPDTINVKVGICLPKDCEDSEIQSFVNQTVNKFSWKIENQINSQINESIWSRLKASNLQVKIAFTILASLLFIVVISTIADLKLLKMKRHLNASILQFIESASIKQNLIKLHKEEENQQKNNFISKNRYYSEILVNVSHFIVFVPLLGTSVINRRIFDWVDLSTKPYLQFLWTDCYYPGLIILASTTASLKMFSLIKRKASGKEFVLNALRRMINFWPILIVLISIQIAMPIFLKSPLAKEFIEPMSMKCQEHWYLNLLFIHTIIPIEDMCLPYTWTISSELQLYLIASLLTYLYIKKPNVGLITNLMLIAIGFLSNIYVSYTGLTTPNVVSFPFDYQAMRRSIFYSHSSTSVQLFTFFTVYLAFYLRLSKRSFKISIEKEMLIIGLLMIYFTTTFHSSIIYNVLNVKPNPILNTIFYMYNRSAFTLLVSWLVLQNYPNGEPSKKEEMKKWINKKLFGYKTDKKENILDELVDDLNTNIHSNNDMMDDYCDKLRSKNQSLKVDESLKRKISSSESTSDLSDHMNEDAFAELIDSKPQDTNNNPVNDFYDRKLIDLSNDRVDRVDSSRRDERLSEEKSKKLSKKDAFKSSNECIKKSKNSKKSSASSILIWIRLDKSIYYSHFFYLIYCFLVNNAQDSDLFSMIISVHCKIFWAYMFAYVFHLLIEKPVSNLTNKLTQMLPIDENVKSKKVD